jgi:hypothetical protein
VGSRGKVGRVPEAPGSREPSQSSAVSAASGFDPSRDVDYAYQKTGEILSYFDSFQLPTWAPVAEAIRLERERGRSEGMATFGELIRALDLAGNRLSLHAVNAIASGDRRAGEYSAWADDVRNLLKKIPRDSDGSA